MKRTRGRGPLGVGLYPRVRGSILVLAAVMGIVLAVLSISGCERSAEASRALIAERRASWAREIAGIKSQHAALVDRLGPANTVAADKPSALRARAVVDGTRQAITDVEIQLAQAEGRMDQAVGRGGEAGQRTIDQETATARAYLQALGEQLVAATQQLGELSRSESDSQKPSL